MNRTKERIASAAGFCLLWSMILFVLFAAVYNISGDEALLSAEMHRHAPPKVSGLPEDRYPYMAHMIATYLTDRRPGFQYYYTEFFTHSYAYVIPWMNRGGLRELHMGTVFDTSEDASVKKFTTVPRFFDGSEDFCLYFDKMTYDEIIPHFEVVRNAWKMKIFDKNGNQLVCSEDDGTVAYVLDKNGNKIWEASAE